MYISTDAISLDGLLETVSCGSTFSNPPSPVHYQNVNCPLLIRSSSYESIDKFNIALDSLTFGDDDIENITTSPIISSCASQNIIQPNLQYPPEKSGNDQYQMKNCTLNVPRTVMSSEESMITATNHAIATKEDYNEKQKQLSDWYYIKTKTSNVEEPTAHGSPKLIGRSRIIPESETTLKECTINPVYNRPYINATGSVSRQPLKWNNYQVPANINSTEIEPLYNEPSDSINAIRDEGEMQHLQQHTTNKSLIREYTHSKAACPPYYCPPDWNSIERRHDVRQPHIVGTHNAPESNALSNVNVKLLKEQYQQQQRSQQREQRTAERRAEIERKNKIQLQLKHWENIGNSNPSTSSSQHKINEIPTLSSCHQQQQQQQKQQQLQLRMPNNRRNCCPNNDSDATCTSNTNNNNATGSIQQPHQLFASNHATSTQLQQQQQRLQLCTAHHITDTILEPTLPIATQRMPSSPLTATPRLALRSKIVQKRPDETSCSSFEQLNIVGIPTGMNADADYMRADNQHDIGEKQCQLHADDVNGSVDGHETLEIIETRTLPVAVKSGTLGSAENVGTLQQQQHSRSFLEVGDNSSLIRTTADLGLSGSSSHYSPNNATRRVIGQTSGKETLRREQQRLQVQLQQNPLTRQLFGIVQDDVVFQPKTPIYRADCELSGSYASLECPSPPGPPICLPESQRDPQARLSNHLRHLYQELCFKEPIIPPWAIPAPPGALCSARLEPDLRLNSNSHGFSESLTVDQILVSLQTKEGSFLEAPRRCLIECPTWISSGNLCLRILHAWAKEPPWPLKGTPVALTLFIPLRELKRSFAHYVEKELLPKGPLNPFSNSSGGFNAAWNSLEALGPKLLIILDGYANQKPRNNVTNAIVNAKKSKSGGIISGSSSKQHYPSDVHDLLDGKLFPEARVIITTYASSCWESMPIVQRHIVYEGLTWGRSVSILEGDQWGGSSQLLDTIQQSVHLRKAVRTPLGCLAVAALFESSGGNLPVEELDVIESILNCVAPEASPAVISELGRLALFCLKMKRSCITMAEIKMYCSIPDNIIGCLDKHFLYGKTAKKKAEYVFNSMCPGMIEFLASNYIASLASSPGLLAAEITGMTIGDELEPELLKVLKFAMALLGERAHILLSRLTPLWLTPQIVFTVALAGGHNESNLAALCDILGISKHPPISPLETKPLWVQVRSVPTDLLGWGMALKSSTCTLKNLEVNYQLEKHNLAETRKAIDVFLDSIALNESVSTLRLSSLIEMDVKDSEISFLANCVSKLLMKPRLENFELVLTLIEEDPPMLKLQSVVAALCRTMPRQPKLSSLLLDLGLSTSQLVQLCGSLEKCTNVTRLSLPHLRCERGAIAALSSLLNARPINFLSLPSCWGARDDPPSSSGVSMGSGSGSSTGTSCLIKQGSLPGVPSPRSYAPGIFSSLPRGVFVPQSSFGRSATLPRQPLEQTAEKRSCDSVVSKTWYPMPACDGSPHNSGTLHDLFVTIRDSYSKLHGLDLSKAQLSLEDSMCLGETVRLSNTLHTLKLEGSSRISEILPSILGASESACLQMLSVGSQRLNLDDSVTVMCARALTSCTTLRLLSLDGWCFRIEHIQTLSTMRAFLSLTSIRELSLSNCRLQTALIKANIKISPLFESRSVVVLKLAGAQVTTLPDMTVLRGPQLLQYIGGFPCLRELDLSAPVRSGVESTHSSPLILDDKCVVHFFQHLHSCFGLLNTLKICNWVIHFDEASRSLKSIAKAMRNSPLSHLKLDGISILDRQKKQRIEAGFIHCFITSLPNLRWMGISLSGKKEDQIFAIGNAVLDLKGTEIEIKLSESTIEQAKLMAQAISVDGKFDIKVSTFGTSSGILIHAEKSGIKSLSRKTKEKEQYF